MESAIPTPPYSKIYKYLLLGDDTGFKRLVLNSFSPDSSVPPESMLGCGVFFRV